MVISARRRAQRSGLQADCKESRWRCRSTAAELELGLRARPAPIRPAVGPFAVPRTLIARERELQIFIRECPPAAGGGRARRQGRHLAAALRFLAIECRVGHGRPIQISRIRSRRVSKDMPLWFARHSKARHRPPSLHVLGLWTSVRISIFARTYCERRTNSVRYNHSEFQGRIRPNLRP